MCVSNCNDVQLKHFLFFIQSYCWTTVLLLFLVKWLPQGVWSKHEWFINKINSKCTELRNTDPLLVNRTRSSGESACSPPICMYFPSLVKWWRMCLGSALISIRFGMWQPIRYWLLRSNSWTFNLTASFLWERKRNNCW